MDNDALLSQIWGGAIELDASQSPSALAGLLTSMISVPLVVLHSDAQFERPVAFMEAAEVMDGVILGDVLAEELGLEIPYGVMILIEPRDFYNQRVLSGSNLGELLGLALLDVAHPAAPSASGKGNADAVALGNPIVALSEFGQDAANRVQ